MEGSLAVVARTIDVQESRSPRVDACKPASPNFHVFVGEGNVKKVQQCLIHTHFCEPWFARFPEIDGLQVFFNMVKSPIY